MAVFRVEKTRNYTVMSNYHLRDKSLSLKAKGLLSLMLSLPEDWDYTTRGLAYICKDGVDSICATVRELEDAGYIVRARERHADGTLGGIEYTILEQPREPEAPKRENPVQVENAGDAPKRAFPEQVKPVLGKPEQENPAQLNIQEQSKEILSTDSTKSFPSFPHKGKPIQESGMERRETYREQIMTNVDYDYLVGYTEVDRGRLDELVRLMLDTVCSTKPTLRVAGEELPAEVVRSRLLKLTGAHLLYVLDRINENTTEVRHVKPYLLTALYKRAAIHHRGGGAERRDGNRPEGKIRTILLPTKLCRKLLKYAKKCGIVHGQIFLTKKGNGLSRTFYATCRDVVRLADVLGHSSIETTHTYLLSTAKESARQLDRLGMLSGWA